MSAPFWGGVTEAEHLWDYCWLGEGWIPGWVKVDVEKARDIDIQKQKGTDGAHLSDEGYVPAKVRILVHHQTPTEWRDWQAFLPKIDPQKVGGLKAPLDIYHPETQVYQVNQVTVEKISSTAPIAKSPKVTTIECLQWFPERKPVKKTNTAKTGTPTSTAEEPDESNIFG